MTNENTDNNSAANPQRQPPGQPPVNPLAPPKPEVHTDPKERNNADQDTAKELAREFRWVEFAQLAVNAVLAVVGLFALWIYHGQLDVMRGQLGEIIRQYPELQKSAQAAHDAADISKDALYSVQRAFVIFSAKPEMNYFRIPGTEGAFSFSIPIENLGITPAHGLKDRVSWVTTTYDLPDNYAFPDRGGRYGTPHAASGANIIASKEKIFSQNVEVDTKVLKQFVEQNSAATHHLGDKTGKAKRIYFYGWATYRDIFKDTPTHLTEFCRYLMVFAVKPQSADVAIAQSEWGYCPHHNCTDEDCTDYKEKVLAVTTASLH